MVTGGTVRRIRTITEGSLGDHRNQRPAANHFPHRRRQNSGRPALGMGAKPKQPEEGVAPEGQFYVIDAGALWTPPDLGCLSNHQDCRGASARVGQRRPIPPATKGAMDQTTGALQALDFDSSLRRFKLGAATLQASWTGI